MKPIFKNIFGPSTFVTAAFIGPGTVTLCTLAGAQTGYALLWALIFSVVATLVLQEMAARVGLITQTGLGELIRNQTSNAFARTIFGAIVFSAIIIGNSAYEAGNIAGAVLGLELFYENRALWTVAVFIIAGLLLYSGSYKLIERFLIALVLVMSICFVLTTLVADINYSALLSGLIPSRTSIQETVLVLGLIGTTVVPYNLFLHASAVSEKWKKSSDLPALRVENAVAVLLGGVVSACIVITAAAALNQNNIAVTSAVEMARQLEPLFGTAAKYVLGIGLFVAGLSSAITAPLAAAYAANGLFNWHADIRNRRFRAICLIVLSIGLVSALSGIAPIAIIKFAQVANGILLPVIAIYLIYVSNNARILGHHANTVLQNFLAAVVVLVALVISYRSLAFLFTD